jgi:hypothetical protein
LTTLEQNLTPQREPVFSAGQLLILHVKSMFGKYRLGVVAHTHVTGGIHYILVRQNRFHIQEVWQLNE